MRLRLLYLCFLFVVSQVVVAQEASEQMLVLKTEKFARTGKQWFNIVADISCHQQYQDLQKALSGLLYGKDYANMQLTDGLELYLSNNYDEIILPNGIDRTLGQKETMKVLYIGGETGKYFNYKVVYQKLYNEGRESLEKTRERHIIYDVAQHKVLTMADVFQPGMIELVKQQMNMGKATPQMELTENGLIIGVIKNGKFLGSQYIFEKQDDNVFTDQFKQLIGFADIMDRKHKADSIHTATQHDQQRILAERQRINDSIQAVAKLKDLQEHSVRLGPDNRQVLCVYDNAVLTDSSFLDNIIMTDGVYSQDNDVTEIDYISPDGTTKVLYTNGNPLSSITITKTTQLLPYPNDAYKQKLEGVVVVSFVVEKDGTKTNKKIERSLCPSLDERAIRMIDSVQVSVFQLFGNPVRRKYQMACIFKTIDYKNLYSYGELLNVYNLTELGKNVGECKIDFNFDIDKGIATRISSGVAISRWGTRFGGRYGAKYSKIDLDVPADPTFESLLCKQIFGKGGKSLKKMFEKVSTDGYGKIGMKNIDITGYCLAYAPGRYIAYGYNDAFSSNRHNVIYGVKEHRLLTVEDLLTADEIARVGISLDASVGMDSLFVYVGKCIYAINQQNWDRFAPVLRNILGNNRETLPQHSPEDYMMSWYYGIQPRKISQKIIGKAGYTGGLDALKAQLAKGVQAENSLFNDYSSRIALLLDENGTVADLDAKTLSGSKQLTDKISVALKQMPSWQPQQLSRQKQPALLVYDFFGAVSEDGAYPPIAALVKHRQAGNNSGTSESSGRDKVFDVIEQMPTFKGGDAALMKYLNNHIKYPVIAEENGIQGRVVTTFVVECDGSITDVRVIKSVDPSLDKEAVRVVKSMPKWNPGRQNGEAVRAKFTLPVTFRLQANTKRSSIGPMIR